MELTDSLPSCLKIPAWFSSITKPLQNPLSFTHSTLTSTLLSSQSLSQNLSPHFPRLSLASFLSQFSLLPSTSSSLSRSLYTNHSPQISIKNTLRLLSVPNSLSVVVFFPTGENADRVGLVTVSVENSGLVVGDKGRVRVSDGKHKLEGHRIVKLLINPFSAKQTILRSGAFVTVSVENSELVVGDESRVTILDAKHNLVGHRIVKLLINPFSGNSSIGFLMACTMYGVQWYSVGFDKNENPLLDFIGCKVFKSCGVVDACWNPHVPEESLVILESGELFLFDIDAFSSGKRLKVSWKDWPNLGKSGWLGCEFGWHPEILVVAHSSAVFLLDFRERECIVTCLLEINTSVMYTHTRNDRFVAFSKAGSDHHRFVVASDHHVVLFDARKALMPLLQWSHDIPNPSYINVLPLSQLRVYYDDGPKGSSELGNCIVMGSLWNCEFNLFCYGPPQDSAIAKIKKYDNKLCSWDIPSELSLSGRDCSCGSCLLREDFWKSSLPPWIDWRQKKEIVLGFDILDKDLDTKLSEGGGFTLIRLMSSGKIESQRYIPSHDFVKIVKEPLKKSVCDYQDSMMFNDTELEYKFPKRFQYQKLDYLCAYMKDDLDKVLFGKVKKLRKVPCASDYISSVDFHQFVCDKLKTCGFNRSSHAVSDMVKRTRLLSSLHEVALSKIWTHLPKYLLRLSFSYYSELLEVLLDNKNLSLEFLDIPSQPQYPPFVFREPSRRSSKWSRKFRPSTGFVGPVLPTPVMLTICEIRKEEAIDFSANSEIIKQCNEVMEVANEIATSCSGSEFHDGPAVSLGDDRDETFDNIGSTNLVSLHKVVPKIYGSPTKEAMSEYPVCCDEKFTTFIYQKSQKEVTKTGAETDGPEIFDSLSPIKLKFDGTMKLGTNTNTFRMLKRRYSNFLQNYDPYQQYLENNNLCKQE